MRRRSLSSLASGVMAGMLSIACSVTERQFVNLIAYLRDPAAGANARSK